MKNAIMGVCVAIIVAAFFVGIYGVERENLAVVLAAVVLAFISAVACMGAYFAEVRG